MNTRIQDLDLFTRLVRTRPLFLAALMYLVGCIAAYVLVPVPLVCLAAAVLITVFAVLFRSRLKAYTAVLILIAMLPLGAWRFTVDWNASAPLETQSEAIIAGRIAQTPVYNADDERTICVLSDFSIDGSPQKGKIRLYLRGDEELLMEAALGQSLVCQGKVWRADEATNPGQFNFSNYLRLNDLRGYATAKIEDAQFSAAELTLKDAPERMRQALSDRIERLFAKNPGIAKAFLIGDRSDMHEDERESYSKSGAAHVLAISGMHVSVLAVCISFLLSRIFERKTSFIITLTLLFCYSLLIGFTPSLVRAILMYAVFSAAPLLGRYSDPPTSLAAAMLFYLLLRPVAILESSFILSFGASAGIIFLSAPLSRLFPFANSVKHTDVGFVRLKMRRLLRQIVQMLTATAAAQLAILPAVVHFFGAQPLWSFVVNLAAVPLAMCGYIVALAAMITGIPLIAQAADLIFTLLTAAVQAVAAFPFASLRVAQFPAWLLIICAVIVIASSDLSKIPGKIRRFMPFFIIVAALISNFCAYLTTLGCSIVFLDAGQADCAVLRSNGKVYMFDTGDAYSPAADYLSAMNYTPEAVFLSHPHADHAGGLDGILDICTPETIYISANWHSFEADESVSAALQRAETQGSRIETVSAGDQISLSKETFLEVLSPAAGFPSDSANDDSLILRIDHNGTRILIGGDAPTSVCSGIAGDIDLLKVAHHGSADSVSADFLIETSPSVAFIPVGYNNYGHPADSTLKFLSAAKVSVYRGDESGAVTCRLLDDGRIRTTCFKFSEETDGLE